MRLIAYCKSCSHPNRISSSRILLRNDLEERFGHKIQYQCKKCLQNNVVHPNQVYAKSSKLPLLICSTLGLIFTFLGFFIPSGASFWCFGIGGAILTAGFISSNSSNSSAFNKSFVQKVDQ